MAPESNFADQLFSIGSTERFDNETVQEWTPIPEAVLSTARSLINS